MDGLGIVVIGRNEGERLRLCLRSLPIGRAPVVYVDSRSSDGSVALARAMNVEVIELDTSRPLSAAWARNAGLDHVLRQTPTLDAIQFVDGDCIMATDWFVRGLAELGARPKVAVVSGRLRERFPNRSIYNRMCDREWRLAPGVVEACGGIAMIRVSALREAGAFDTTIYGPEDTELCTRLRLRGWTILHLETEMGQHDAAMTRFAQWWRRCVRTGQGYAQVARMYRSAAIPLFVRQSRSVWFWGAGVPLLVLGLLWPTHGLSLVLLAVYPLNVWRVYRRERRGGATVYDALLYATSCILSKFPQLQGQMRFQCRRLFRRHVDWVEHKCDARSATDAGPLQSTSTPCAPTRSAG